MDLLVVLLTIPLITAFIGLLTNWLAVKMIFWPLQFVGVGPVGWQGVLPRRSETFAADVADTMEQQVLTTQELVERIDLADLEVIMESRLADAAPVLVGEAAEVIRPGVWETIAEPAQAMIVEQVVTETRSTAREVFDRLRARADELLDLRSMVIGLLSGDNTTRLVRLFQEIGGPELRWIIWYGGIFGLVVGLVQAASFGVFDQWWLLPIIGGIVGLGTNWLALQMIFRPRDPVSVLGVTVQGLFPKRQAEISSDYGRIAATEILTPANILARLTEGTAGSEIARTVLEVATERIDAQRPMLDAIAGVPVTDEQIDAVKLLVLQRVLEQVPEVQPEIEAFLADSLDVQGLVEGKLSSLSKPEFERLLRGIFEQDEWILIVIGGALGLFVGLLQGALVLATGA